MRDLRIIFMGTPDFAVTILKHLVENKYTIAGVITAPDKPAGRGRKLNESAVKKYANSQNLNILQPINLKNEDFLQELKAMAPLIYMLLCYLPIEVLPLYIGLSLMEKQKQALLVSLLMIKLIPVKLSCKRKLKFQRMKLLALCTTN